MNWVEFYAFAVVVSLLVLLYLEVEWREEPRPLCQASRVGSSGRSGEPRSLEG